MVIFYLKNERFHEPKGWIFIRLAWFYHNDRFKTLLVFGDLDLEMLIVRHALHCIGEMHI